MDNGTSTFLTLLRAGLWEQDVQLSEVVDVDYEEVLRIAKQQTVIGVVTAGLEHVVEVQVPKDVLRRFVVTTFQIEQRNKSMNVFLSQLIIKLRNENVFALLVKGQGVAQCYERPLFRVPGDIDLLLSEENYEKAKQFLFPLSDTIHEEVLKTKHQALDIKGIEVELHGRMPFGMSRRVEREIGFIIKNSTEEGGVIVWNNNDTEVYLPNPDNHVVIIFTHFLQHFFIEGVGLRQICDWVRMLWTYRDSMDIHLLEQRICRMGLMSEWKAFASLAVDYLGMPVEAMPFYDSRFKNKGDRVLRRVFMSGNFGHNKDLSYRIKYSGFRYNMVSLWRRIWDFASLVPVFPLDTPRFLLTYLTNKV